MSKGGALLLLVLCLSGCTPEPRGDDPRVPPVIADPAPPLGTWRITSARNFDGARYTGTVAIERLRGEVYRVTWRTSLGSYSGLGFYRDKHLLVGWGMSRGYGVVLYERDGTSFRGVWTQPGKQIGTEAFAGTELEGEHTISGENPGTRKPYRGALVLDRLGPTWQAHWRSGSDGESYQQGVGLELGHRVVFGFGVPGTVFGAVDYDFSDPARVRGRWAAGAGGKVGREDLAR